MIQHRASASSAQTAIPAPPVDIADNRGRRLARPTLVHVTVTDAVVSFPEPVGLYADECVLVSIWFPNGGVHCLAAVEHLRRTPEFRTEVTLTFERLSDDDRQLLADYVAGAAHTTAS